MAYLLKAVLVTRPVSLGLRPALLSNPRARPLPKPRARPASEPDKVRPYVRGSFKTHLIKNFDEFLSGC